MACKRQLKEALERLLTKQSQSKHKQKITYQPDKKEANKSTGQCIKRNNRKKRKRLNSTKEKKQDKTFKRKRTRSYGFRKTNKKENQKRKKKRRRSDS